MIGGGSRRGKMVMAKIQQNILNKIYMKSFILVLGFCDF